MDTSCHNMLNLPRAMGSPCSMVWDSMVQAGAMQMGRMAMTVAMLLMVRAIGNMVLEVVARLLVKLMLMLLIPVRLMLEIMVLMVQTSNLMLVFFQNNRVRSEASKLTYIAPSLGKLVLVIEEIDSVEAAFGFCLVGYVMGPRPSPYALLNFVKGWGNEVKFTFKENGWIRFQFQSAGVRDRVLNGGSENLVRDTYLRQNMDGDGWVSIILIATFKKLLDAIINLGESSLLHIHQYFPSECSCRS